MSIYDFNALKIMEYPQFPPMNFVHCGIMFQNKMFRKERKNGHMIFEYCPLKKDYADTIIQKQLEKNEFPVYPACPPRRFVHAGTLYKYKECQLNEQKGYMIFSYCPFKKDEQQIESKGVALGQENFTLEEKKDVSTISANIKYETVLDLKANELEKVMEKRSQKKSFWRRIFPFWKKNLV